MNADGTPDDNPTTGGTGTSTSTVTSAGAQDSGFAEALKAAGEVPVTRAKTW